ncbi:ribonuclease III [Flavobacteriales bacterium]|nr:ribonuclease III [Flavobacteriales bacterium]
MGFKTSNKQYYIKALQHKSYNINSNNERLEFLGDAILNSIVSEQLFLKNKNKEEGFLSQQRAIIVSRKHLNKVGKKLISPVNIKSRLKILPEKIFGNTLEAIIGAIYIDKGIGKTKEFIVYNIINSEFITELTGTDYKSDLQKLAQNNKQKIKYKLLESKGPDHNKEFTVAVFVDNVNISQAKAPSIKEAEQIAAKRTLNIVF